MDAEGYPIFCQVCGNPGKERRSSKRVLCDNCWQAALYFKKPVAHLPWHGPPKNIALPNDGGHDTYEGMARRIEE